jgi:Tol biopolymer transport system component
MLSHPHPHQAGQRPWYQRILSAGSTVLLVLLLALLLTACGTTNSAPGASVGAEATNTPVDNQTEPTSALVATTTAQPAEEPTAAPPTAEPTAVPTAGTGEEYPAPPTQEASPNRPPTAVPTAEPTSAPTPTAAPQPSTFGSEVLFLRGGTLLAYDMDSNQERILAPNVHEFAATADGSLLALVRRPGGQDTDIWVVQRDGNGLRQLTRDTRAEGSLSWAPDGRTLVYASAETLRPHAPDWTSWAQWCSGGEVRLLDTNTSTVTALEPGCDPQFSHDGRRIAFATPPQDVAEATQNASTATEDNTIRLINRQGENGWSFAAAAGTDASAGHLVYAPAWSPNDEEIAYQRFIGYQALVDINYIEMGGSFQGNGDLLGQGAGWLMRPHFAPQGERMAVVQYNFSDARGVSGYEPWSAQVLRTSQQGAIFLPTGERQTDAVVVDELPRATSAIWAPDGQRLAVVLPPDWYNVTSPQEAPFQSAAPGELWLWEPGSPPTQQLVSNVDFASPLVWLPAR